MDKDQWEFGKPPVVEAGPPQYVPHRFDCPSRRYVRLPWWHKDRLPFNVRWWLWYGWTGRIYDWIHRDCY